MNQKEIVSLGVDLEEVARFRKYVLPPSQVNNNSMSKKFLRRVFSSEEREYCFEQVFPERHLAARFCAKEASYKAISQALSFYSKEKLQFFRTNFFVNSSEVTKVSQIPTIKLAPKLNSFLQNLFIQEQKYSNYKLLLTLSHTKEWAVAQVLIQTFRSKI